jgi:toxin YoeB
VAKVERAGSFQRQFVEDLQHWVREDRKLALRVLDLVTVILRDPFHGVGKPEPLRHLGSDVWSRRIDQANRLVYVVYRDRVDFLQARYHY